MTADKYLFWRALRPFSFSVALIVCLTGIVAAYRDGATDLILAGLILGAGLLLQAGVNLINDYSDLALLGGSESGRGGVSLARRRICCNYRAGLLCFLLATAIGLYLIYLSGPLLLLFAIIGLIGALGYTLEPLNYKRRGLAVVLVFWLMGVLMVTGSYYILVQQLTLEIFLLSVPVSLFTSLLLLSNELRDFEQDRALDIRTLSVRLGYTRAARIYQAGLLAIYVAVLGLYLAGFLPGAIWVLLSLPIVLLPLRLIDKPQTKRLRLTPETGRAFLIFGVSYCVALLA